VRKSRVIVRSGREKKERVRRATKRRREESERGGTVGFEGSWKEKKRKVNERERWGSRGI